MENKVYKSMLKLMRIYRLRLLDTSKMESLETFQDNISYENTCKWDP